MPHDTTYVAFAAARRIASGPLDEVLPVLKRRFDRDRSDLPLVFDTATGRQVDFDLRGTIEEVIARAAPAAPGRGPGRPRLGVTSREVSLLPRHWDWLEQQSSGLSGALRRLIDRAIANEPGSERARRIRAALGQLLSAMAGDRPGYEEATRALYAGDAARVDELTRKWPRDIRDHALARMEEAARAERTGGGQAKAAVAELYDRVWSQGDHGAIERLIALRYTIHSDPGDPWDGQTLDRAGYARRVDHSRSAFPDLAFTVHALLEDGDRVAVRWSAEGTHRGDLPGLPATGQRLRFAGQTIYAIDAGRVAGHWQIVDRLGFIAQLRRG